MAPLNGSERVAFGPFEINFGNGSLFKHGVRIRLSGQPFRILMLLLSRPGEAVSQEELRKEIWGNGTFVDFEHSLHAAINKLRRALSDSAENPRYIETVTGRGYRFIGVPHQSAPPPVQTETVSVAEEPNQPLAAPAPVRPRRLWWVAAAACLVAGSGVASFWRLQPRTPEPWKLNRITSDAGVSDSPALSRDGKLIAYSNERNGVRDLYVKQIAGGRPIQLTFDGVGNTSPDFSPDGSRIVFRSDRDGGGIYQIPALGGEPVLVAPEGRNPKYSPDGTQLAFWIGDPIVLPSVPGVGTVWVAASSGGHPHRIGLGFTTARSPLWTPDGKHLLLVGYASNKTREAPALDWWVVSTDGDTAVRTGFHEALLAFGLRYPGQSLFAVPAPGSTMVIPEPACWFASGNRVAFSARNGDTRNIWETEISREGRIAGTFQRLTASSGDEINISCGSGDSLAFARVDVSGNVWSLPFDLNRAKPAGDPYQITRRPALREGPSVSADGRRFAFSSAQAGPMNIWVQDIGTDREIPLAVSQSVQRYPLITPSGDRVAYSAEEDTNRVLYVSSPGGVPEKLCEGCLRPTDWLRDEKMLLTFSGNPYQVSVLDLATHQRIPILTHPAYSLLYAHLSADQHWIVFTARVKPDRAYIMAAPFAGPNPIPEASWIRISEEKPTDYAIWSPDGKTLYFTSSRDGHLCLWGQRVDSNSHSPIGHAFVVRHFHERPLHPIQGLTAGSSQFAVDLMETSGSIWMMTRAPSR